MKLFKSQDTLYDSNDIVPLSPNLYPAFLNTKNKSNEPESPRFHSLIKENYTYIPLEIDINFNPAILEQDFFWISRLKKNLIKKSPAIQKTLY